MATNNSPSTTIQASPSEVNALLELIKRKPPPKVDGLVAFATSDLRKQYSPEERNAMLESSEGQRLIQALSRCDGVNKQMRNSRDVWLQDRDNKAKAQKLAEDKIKYIECLTYISCPSRWNQYTRCWSSLSQLNPSQLKRLEHFGPEIACKYERHLLEQCVGSLVAGTIKAADSVYEKDDIDLT